MTIRLTEHKTLHHQRLIALIFIIVAAALVGYFAIASNYFSKQMVEPEVVAEHENIVYFSAQADGDADAPYVVYSYNYDNNEWSHAFNTPLVYSAIAIVSPKYAIASLYDETISSTTTGPVFAPWVFSEADSVYAPLAVKDYRVEQDYVLSTDDSDLVAYSATDAAVDGDTIHSLDNWSIVITSLQSGITNQEIKGAARPQWINGHELIYLKSDGIYTYNLDTTTERMVVSANDKIVFSFSAREELAAAKDGSMLVITSPGENLLITMNLNEQSEYQLIDELSAPDTTYSSPMISSDESRVAVVVTTAVSDSEATATAIHLYDIKNIYEQPLELPLGDFYNPASLEIVGWTQHN